MVRFNFIGLVTFVSLASAEKPKGLYLLGDDGEKDGPKKGKLSVEKGIKCKAGFDMSKGAGSKCEAGLKQAFCAGTKAEDVAGGISGDLQQQLLEIFMQPGDMNLPEDTMNEMKFFDDDAVLEGLEDGFEKALEFGGVGKVEFGCKVTFSKKGGKFSKNVECGAKGGQFVGLKPKSIEFE